MAILPTEDRDFRSELDSLDDAGDDDVMASPLAPAPGSSQTAQSLEKEGYFRDRELEQKITRAEEERSLRDQSAAGLFGNWGTLDEAGKEEWTKGEREAAKASEEFWTGLKGSLPTPTQYEAPARDGANFVPGAGPTLSGIIRGLPWGANAAKNSLYDKVDSNIAHARYRQKLVDEIEAGRREAAKYGTTRNVTEQAITGLVDVGVGGSVSGLGRLGGYGGDFIAKKASETLGGYIKSGSRYVQDFGNWISAKSQEYFPNDEARQMEFSTALANGAGTMISMIGPGAFAQVATRGGVNTISALVRNPELATSVAEVYAKRAATGTAAATGSLMQAESMAQDAEDARAQGKDVSDDDVFKAFMIGLPLGATDALPIDKLFSSVEGPFVKSVLAAAIKEGGQEFGQTLGENITAQQLYDPERRWDEGAYEAALVGAILGGGIETSRRAIQEARLRTRGTTSDATEGAPPAPEAEAAPKPGKKSRTFDLNKIAGLQNEPGTTPAPGEAAEFQARIVDAEGNVVSAEADSTAQTTETAAPSYKTPSFSDVISVLPQDESGDPDTSILQERVQALGKPAWNKLSPEEKVSVFRELGGEPQVDPAAAAAKPAPQPAAQAEQAAAPAPEAATTAAEAAPAAETETAAEAAPASQISESTYKRFISVLAGSTTRPNWAKSARVSEQTLQALMQRAEQDGILRRDGEGTLRRSKNIKAAIKKLRSAASAPASAPAAAPQAAAAPSVTQVAAQLETAATPKPKRPSLQISPEVRLEKAIRAAERANRKPLLPQTITYAQELDAARGTPAFDEVVQRLTADGTITKREMQALARVVGEAQPKSGTKQAALQSIVQRHNEALQAREGIAPEVTPDAVSDTLEDVAGGVPEEVIPEGLEGLEGERVSRDAPGTDQPGRDGLVGGQPGANDDVAGSPGELRGAGEETRADPGNAEGRGDAGSDLRAAERVAAAEPVAEEAPPAPEISEERRAEIARQVEADAQKHEQARQDRLARNYEITDADEIGKGGAKAKVKANIDAIRVLKEIEDAGREATEEEKKILVKYVGWGAFAQDVFTDYKTEWAKERKQIQDLLSPDEYKRARASTLNAHYTSSDVIRGMWTAIEHLGFTGGRALEPSAGIGHYIGLTPKNLRETTDWTAVELDSLSGRITKALYGAADVRVAGFETQNWPDNFFDLAISNVPFGDYRIEDTERKGFLIHDYFFVKSLAKVRPGGVVAFITSAGTLDKQNARARRAMARHATFLGAIRLPGGSKGAFKANAGTDVTTDIVFMRKRVDGEPIGDQSWLELKEVKTPEGPAMINSYFADHPEMMLGKMRLVGTMYGKNEPVLIGSSEDLEAKIIEAAKNLPEGAMLPRNTTGAELLREVDTQTDGIKEGAFYEKDGKIFRKVAGVGEPQKLNAKDAKRARQFMAIRDVVNEMLAKQSRGDRVGMEDLREALAASYDEFVKTNGPINLTTVSTQNRSDGKEITIRRQPNLTPFIDDPDAFKVSAIESYDEKTQTAKKTAIFTQDILAAYVTPEIRGPSDALAVSLNETGRVDMPSIANRLGVSEAEAALMLGDEIYLDPTGDQWRTAAQYLSGDVVAKLEAAKLAAERDQKYARNVEALTKVQPEPLTRVDISVPIGATWVPTEIYEQFAMEKLGGYRVKIALNEVTKRWKVIAASFPYSAEEQFGTKHKTVTEILEAALNSTLITITQKHSDGTTTRLPEAEQEAQAKVDLIRETFSGNPDLGQEGWVWEDEDRAQRLEALYNRSFNRLVPEVHDGSHLTFPGLARVVTAGDGSTFTINLSPHRVNAIWRIIQNGNTLIDHVVGAGKTWTSIMAGMEMKRLGQIQRPMYVVPNHMLEQFSTEFYQAYPNAKLLVATKDQMSSKRRREFAAKVASDTWDGIIITHSAYSRIGMSDEAYKAYYQEQIEAMEDAKLRAAIEEGKDTPTVKDIEKAKKRLETKLDKLLKKEKKDQGVTFEELGVDFQFVDEAHLFKNLWFPTRHTRVKGIASGESQRATDLYVKIRHMEKSRPGRSTVFLTGTPVSNTMAELYVMQRYLQHSVLQEYGIDEFDAWAATFGEIRTQTELAPNGRDFKDTTSFSRFVNVPELMTIWGRVADTQTADMLNLPRPKMKDGKIRIVENDLSASEEQEIQRIITAMENMKGQKPKPGEPNFLSMFTQGIQLATDQRLVDPSAPFNPSGKIAKAVENITRVYQEGNADPKAPNKAQIVFLDMGVPGSKAKGALKGQAPVEETAESKIEEIRQQLLAESGAETDEDVEIDEGAVEAAMMLEGKYNLYQDLKDRLIEQGIPAEEIAFIHDAKNDKQKADLFGKVKSGKVRVLIGSTSKMGVGTNVQKLLIAMHHLDAPWKPADVEQRDGRILRQGNLNPEIEIYRYITKRSFDAYRWQILDRKSKFIGQLRAGAKGVRSAEDIDPPLPEAEELKAAATGDPRIIEHAELSKEVRQLEVAKKVHVKSQTGAAQKAVQLKERLEKSKERLAVWSRDAERIVDLTGDNFKVTFDEGRGKMVEYTERKKAGERIRGVLLAFAENIWYGGAREIDLGELSGFQMIGVVQRTQEGFVVRARLAGDEQYETEPFMINDQTEPVSLMGRWVRLVKDPQIRADAARGAIAQYETEIPKLEEAAKGKPFPKQARLEEAKGRLAALTAALKPQKPGEFKQSPEEAAREEAYVSQAMRNLAETSRTAQGVVDTSASAGKAEKMAEGLTPEAAMAAATSNFERVVRELWRRRDTIPKTGEEMAAFADNVALEVNQGILKPGALMRTDDSTKYPYTAANKLELARAQFGEELARRLNDPDADPVETAAWIEWRANLTDHFWADGVGKTSKALAYIPLMKAGLPLPVYPDSKTVFALSAPSPMNPENGAASYLDGNWDKFLAFYRTLVPDEKLDEPNFGLPAPPIAIPEGDPLLVSHDTDTSPERLAMRERLIEQRFAGKQPAQGRKPVAYVMGGGGASGKGTVMDMLREEGVVDDSFVELDPDSFKTGDKTKGWDGIPEYWEIDARGDSRGAAVTHEESSVIHKQALKRAMEGGYDLTLDVTLGTPAKAVKVLQDLKNAGYHVALVGVTVNAETAITRAVARAKGKSRRFVPLNQLLAAHKGFSQGFNAYAEIADTAVLVDTDVGRGETPRLIAEKEMGESLKILSKHDYMMFAGKEALNDQATTLRQLRTPTEPRPEGAPVVAFQAGKVDARKVAGRDRTSRRMGAEERASDGPDLPGNGPRLGAEGSAALVTSPREAIQDFVKAVADLKERLTEAGPETSPKSSPINRDAIDAEWADLSDLLASIKGQLAPIDTEVKGSRIEKLAEVVRDYRATVDEMLAVARRQEAIDTTNASAADLSAFLDALDDLDTMLSERAQEGYDVDQEISDYADELTERIEDVVSRYEAIADNAEQNIDLLNDTAADLDALIPETEGDEEQVDLEQLIAEVKSAPRLLDRLPVPATDANALDVLRMDVGELEKIAEELEVTFNQLWHIDTEAEVEDPVEAAKWLDKISELQSELISMRDYARLFAETSRRKGEESSQALERIRDEIVKPMLDAIEEVADKVRDRHTDESERVTGAPNRPDDVAPEESGEFNLPLPPYGDQAAWLQETLARYGIDTGSWGQGEAKSLNNLLKEIQDGETELVARDGEIFRRVSAMGVDVYADVDGARLKVREDRQVFNDGRVRRRSLPRSLGEKLKAGEDPDQALRRTLQEELGVTQYRRIEGLVPKVTQKMSPSYPGLLSEYRAIDTAVLIAPAEFKADGHEEVQADKRNYFVWEPAGNVPASMGDVKASIKSKNKPSFENWMSFTKALEAAPKRPRTLLGEYRVETRAANGSMFYDVFRGTRKVGAFYLRTDLTSRVPAVSVQNMVVDPKERRRGIASAVYDLIEADIAPSGLELVTPQPITLSEEGRAFWEARDPAKLEAAEEAERAPFLSTDVAARITANAPGVRPSAAALAKQEEIKAAILAVAKRLPKSIRVNVEQRIHIGGYALHGLYHPSARVVHLSLESGLDQALTTIRHEEIHVLKDLGLITEKEWNLLVERANKIGVRRILGDDVETYREGYMGKVAKRVLAKKGFVDLAQLPWADVRKALIEQQGFDPERGITSLQDLGLWDEAEFKALIDEEAVAVMVSEYMGGARYGSGIDRLIQRVADFLARIGNALRGLGFKTVEDVFEAIEGGVIGQRPLALRNAGGVNIKNGVMYAVKAYHGTSAKFRRFSVDHMSKGSGAQAYGWGLYFAESQAVAESYMGAGPPQRYQPGVPIEDEPEGQLYEVRISADEDSFIDFDKSLEQQSPAVLKALEPFGREVAAMMAKREAENDEVLLALDEDEIYTRPIKDWMLLSTPELVDRINSREIAQRLARDGISGVKFLDGFSREIGEGTSNFVVFDENAVEILTINGEAPSTQERKQILDQAKLQEADGSMFSMGGGEGTQVSPELVKELNDRLADIRRSNPKSKPIPDDILMAIGRSGNYKPMQVGDPAAPQAKPKAPEARLSEVVETLIDSMGLTVRQGRLNPGLKAAAGRVGGKLMGQFSKKTGVTRLAIPLDLKTLAHEGGHALEARASTRTVLASIKKQHIEELTTKPAADGPAPNFNPTGYSGFELDDSTQDIARRAAAADATWRTLATQAGLAKSGHGKAPDPNTYAAAHQEAAFTRSMLIRRLGRQTADAVIADISKANPADPKKYTRLRFSRTAVQKRPAVTANAADLSEGFAEWFSLYVTNAPAARALAPGFYRDFEDVLDGLEPAMLEHLHEVQASVAKLTTAAPAEAVRSRLQSTVPDSRYEQLKEAFSGARAKAKDAAMGAGGKGAGPAGRAAAAAGEFFSNLLSDKLYAFYHAVFDNKHPMKKAMDFLLRTAEENLNVKVDKKHVLKIRSALQDPYKLWRLAEHSKAHATAILQFGVWQKGTVDPSGPSYWDALAMAFGGTERGQWNDDMAEQFGSYLVARRMLAEFGRFDRGELENPPDRVIDRKVWEAAKAELETANPQFKQAADLMYKFQRNMLQYKFDNGFLTQEMFDELLQRIDYAPLNRIMDPVATAGLPGVGRNNKRRLIYQFKGSTRDFINPLETIAQDVFATQERVALNRVIGAMDRMARAAGPGGGLIAERIPAKDFKATTMDLRQALKAAAKTQGLAPDDAAGLMDMIDNLFDQDAAATVFKATDTNEANEQILYLWEGGKKVPIRLGDHRIAKDIFDGIAAFGENNSELWVDALALGTQALRAGITKAPSYILVNFLRDQLQQFALSENFIPFLTGAKGMKSVVTNDATAKRYSFTAAMMGGVDANLIQDISGRHDVLTLRRKGFWATPAKSGPGQFWQSFLRTMEITEAASRFGHFEASYQRAMKDGFTPEEAMFEAAYAAHDIMDFSRRGAKMVQVAKVIAFLNAALQGLDVGRRTLSGERDSYINMAQVATPYIKAATGSPLTLAEKRALPNAARAWVKIVSFGMVGLALAALYDDDPEYEEFNDYMKATHWFFKLNGTWYRFPKPFELAFFSNLFEAMHDGFTSNDPRWSTRFLASLKHTMVPPHEINMANLYYELATGIDLFGGQEIVPDELSKLPAELQFNAYTSELARLVGGVTGQSPAVVDHFMQGIFGTVGRDITSLSDRVLPGFNQLTGGALPNVSMERADKSPEDMAVLSRFMRRPARGALSKEEFWKQMSRTRGEFSKAAAGYKMLKESGRGREARDLLEGATDEEKAYAILEGDFEEKQQDIHPLNRARQVMSAMSGIRREMVLDKLFKAETAKEEEPERIVIPPAKQRIVNEILEDLSMREARNALVVIGHPGWAQKDIMPTDGLLAELKAAVPEIADELEYRLNKGRNKVYPFEGVRRVWAQARERLLKDGADADLSDLVPDAAFP